MVTLMIGVFLSPLNVSFTSVALPTMRTHFAISVEQVTWVATAYFIPMVVLMSLWAAIGERWGLRRTYVLGLSLLGLGGFFSALAPNFNWLLLSRILQGVGWSALYPIALVLIRTLFESNRQGEMMGLWESSVGVATIVAPVFGGFIVEYLGWSVVYVVLGIVAFVGGLIAAFAIPKRIEIPVYERFDWTGALSFTSALLLTLLAMVGKNVSLLVIGGFVWILWILHSQRTSNPFVSPRIFANRQFITASTAALIRMAIAISALTALPFFFEDIQNLRPVLVGSLMLIYSLFLFSGAFPGGRWSDRSGARVPAFVGYLAMIAGVIMLLGFDMKLAIFPVGIALAIRGVGAGLTQAPLAKTATSAKVDGPSAVLAGLYGTIRYSGLALGTAMTGIFLERRLHDHDFPALGPQAGLLAFRELWVILVALGILGLLMVWLMGASKNA